MQVAGYFERYNGGLTFLTVKGAGHMVPKDRPAHALDMRTAFLDAKPSSTSGGGGVYGEYDRVTAAPPTPLCGAPTAQQEL